jgi:DNA invertase Pin-like site-specific DNA recombinase
LPAALGPLGVRRPGQRCAIYTRKSSEEGLEQAFNSLDAQREACEAYIHSQCHEGWTLLPARYDDGGLSGGTLERPALQRLLADIAVGRVDLVVVYKVDRLTRSLGGFSKIVEAFDAQGVSFVSVTQQFNTTTSIGRLTLNMLLSFAQFEREVTAERIRDKIAASKRKGMWMGGTVPLGYQVQDRKLIPHPEQAKLVQRIFQSYLELGTVRQVQHQPAEDRVVGKTGRPLSFEALFYLLQNRIYRGEVAHRGQAYSGEHPAIIETELWDAVQGRFAQARRARRSGANASHPSLLAGLLIDPAGEPMTATQVTKAGRRYRYYVSSALVTGTREEHADGLRVPAAALEKAASDRLTRLLADGPSLVQALQSAGQLPPDGTQQRRLLSAAQALVERWHRQGQTARRDLLLGLDAQVIVQRHELAIRFSAARLLAMLAGAPARDDLDGSAERGEDAHQIVLTEPVALRRAGREMALLVGSTLAADRSDPSLVRLIAKAWALREALVTSSAPSLTAFAATQGISQSYATRLVRLAWLAPDIVEAILEGRQPKGVTATALMHDTRIPTDWQDQRRALGFD